MRNDLLLVQLKEGKSKAYEWVFDQYFKPLTVYTNGLVRDLDLAQELVQQVLVALYENRQNLTIKNLPGYLYRSARNKALDHLRQQKIRSHHHNEILKSSDDRVEIGDEFDLAQLSQRLHQSIAELPPRCRHIMTLSRIDGLSNDEIASKLSLSKRTVETQISSGLKRIRAAIFSR